MNRLALPHALIMCAPNGARRSKSDHPELPITIAQTVAVARECFAQGAAALHAHVRGTEGKHVLDAGLYRELIDEMAHSCPQMAVQITTEAVGLYSPKEQSAVVKAVVPDAVSVALSEMAPKDGDIQHARNFYHWAQEANVGVQHILYSPEDMIRLTHAQKEGIIPPGPQSVLFVLGRYTADQQSDPMSLIGFLAALQQSSMYEGSSWMVCAFGLSEQRVLTSALALGGHARVGFENNLYRPDGSLSKGNPEQVSRLSGVFNQLALQGQNKELALQTLGRRS